MKKLKKNWAIEYNLCFSQYETFWLLSSNYIRQYVCRKYKYIYNRSKVKIRDRMIQTNCYCGYSCSTFDNISNINSQNKNKQI